MDTTVSQLWLIGLIPLLPALGALINGVFGSRLPKRVIHWIACSAIGLSFVVTVLCIRPLLASDDQELFAHLYKWFEVGGFRVDITFFLDPLSVVMCLVVTGVSFIIHVYSIGYMWEDESYSRYFAYLNFFCFAMLVLVLGDSLVLLFVGWEGVGLASYLLIGFWYGEEERAAAGKKAFIVNRIGDFGFVLGMVMLVTLTGTLDVSLIRETVTSWDAGQLADFAPFAAVVALLFFVGATGKSAQIPLYVWLPDAMAGPTPVSALIHAATMVTAGVYMTVRLNFLYTLSPAVMMVVAVVGALTALVAGTIGILQRDIKRILAYSTVSQLGYMFLAVGVGAYTAAIFHLVTHAFFKALLFLGSGAIIHALHGEQDVMKMGGLRKKLPITHATFLVACLAISGVPLLAGFFSKDEILWGALAGTVGPGFLHGMLWLVGAATAGITAFYMFRCYFLTFWGEYRGKKLHIHKPATSMTAPLVALAVLSVVGGYLGVAKLFYPIMLGLAAVLLVAGLGWLGVRYAGSQGELEGDGLFQKLKSFLTGDVEGALGWGALALVVVIVLMGIGLGSGSPHYLEHWLDHSIVHYEHDVLAGASFLGHFEASLGHGWEVFGMLVSVAVGLAGIYVAYYLYVKRPELPERIRAQNEPLYKVVFNKYWVDEAYDKVVVRPLRATANALYRVVDRVLVDTLMVEGFGAVGRAGGLLVRQLQNGDVQRYAFFILFGLSLILYLVFVG